jgi:Protein-L-isoaspartate(D-aspartate) O-methyltransferase (PCMT)
MLFLGGGGTHVEPPEDLGNAMIRCRRVHYNHAWIVHRRAARQLIHALCKKPFRHPCSDQTIGAMQKLIPTYAPKQWVAFQRKSASDNGFGLTGRSSVRVEGGLRPWMHDDEMALLHCSIKPGMKVLEWGAGGSTLLLAQLVGTAGWVDSIEHNDAWVEKVGKALAASGDASHAVVHHVPPAFGTGTIMKARNKQFAAYVTKASQLELVQTGKTFDACLIDGRDRIRCALVAAKLLRSGALLYFHDFAAADRARYREWLPELLRHYKLRLIVSHTPQTMAVFERL